MLYNISRYRADALVAWPVCRIRDSFNFWKPPNNFNNLKYMRPHICRKYY